MPLRSALEDLVETTLAGVVGLLGKIAYLRCLRGPGQCSYSHWGLSRIYGEEGTQQAFREAHRSLFLQILRTPLRNLREDATISCAASEISPREFVEDLQAGVPALLPQDLGGGSARHFSSVLHALSSLALNRTNSPPGATPPA